MRRAALVALLLLGACSSSSPTPPDRTEAIALLPAAVEGPFPLIDARGLPHGWIAVAAEEDREELDDAFGDLEVEDGWLRIEPNGDLLRVEFDTRAEEADDRDCTDSVEHTDGTPRAAIDERTAALGPATPYVVKHDQWLGDPSAYASIRMEDGSRVLYNAITADDGSLVLVSICR